MRTDASAFRRAAAAVESARFRTLLIDLAALDRDWRMVKRGRSAAAARAPTRLGELNDITVHQHLTSDLAAESVRRAKRNGAGKMAFAAGLLSGHEQARLVAVLDSADLAFRRCDQIKL